MAWSQMDNNMENGGPKKCVQLLYQPSVSSQILEGLDTTFSRFKLILSYASTSNSNTCYCLPLLYLFVTALRIYLTAVVAYVSKDQYYAEVYMHNAGEPSGRAGDYK